jgi:hypothetical protein
MMSDTISGINRPMHTVIGDITPIGTCITVSVADGWGIAVAISVGGITVVIGIGWIAVAIPITVLRIAIPVTVIWRG